MDIKRLETDYWSTPRRIQASRKDSNTGRCSTSSRTLSYGRNIKQKCLQNFKNKLETEAESRSKMIYYLEGKKDWKISNRSEYMNKLNRKEAGTIYSARTRMLDIKGNYPGKYLNQNNLCRKCNSKEETQTHVLEECDSINKNHIPITKEMIFNEEVQKLKDIAKVIDARLKEIEI